MPTALASTGDPPRPRPIREPHPWVQMLAMAQIPFEFGAFLASMPALSTLQRGDGHPVLVMPGFMGGDSSTLPLRTFLWSWGYDVHGFGERPNPGPTPVVLDELSQQLVSIHQRTGQTVSLVGWSAGGRFARYLARQHPESVRQVVSLAAGLQAGSARTDRASRPSVDDRNEDVEVYANHVGRGVNPSVLMVIADWLRPKPWRIA
jgi:pimeloyl-ACP methyl ester carboxylesterase